jgi:hypothetical protein
MRNHSILGAVIIVLLVVTTTEAKYSGGTGEPNDPYQIATPEDLNDIGNYEEDWDKNFILVNDVNLAEYTGTQFNIIGKWFDWNNHNNKPFTGVFDGNDHKIWNFTWSSTDVNGIGLFRYVGSEGQIKNVGMENVDVNTVNGVHVGSLVGISSDGIITNCYLTGSVLGYYNIGGLVGYNRGTISNCYFRGSVSGGDGVGGLCGENHYGTISACYARGAVTGGHNSRYLGGLCGYTYYVTISNCYATGNVTGGDNSQCLGGLFGVNNHGGIIDCYATGNVTGGNGSSNVGGLCGRNRFSTIDDCFATGTVTGGVNSTDLGGLCGSNDTYGMIGSCYATGNVTGGDNSQYLGGLCGMNTYSGAICDCYSTGSVTGAANVGGLVGWNSGTIFNPGKIHNCYSTGNVTGGNGSGDVGGLVGGGDNFEGAITSSFWDVNTSGCPTSAGGTGKTTAEMKTAKTYFGWNGCGEIIWTIDEGNDYPRLAWEGKPGQPLPMLSNFLEGSGMENDPYQVSTAEQLNLIGLFPCEWDKYYILVADINLADYSGTRFNIIGSVTGFTGVFDGNDHKIWNFKWNSNGIDGVGLFGYVGSGGQIKNLGLENVDVNAVNGDYVGGLVGENYGSISNCYSTGSVGGAEDYVGGLVGDNGGAISNCYSTGSVSGTSYVGGLVGENGGDVTHCYSTGAVSGVYEVGGLVGYNWGNVTGCYSTGAVNGGSDVGGLVGGNYYGSVSNCYSTGSVSGTADFVGGLAGYNYYATVTNCYSTGNVDANDYVGGLAGRNYQATIANCYSTGVVDGNDYTGGFVGDNNEAVVIECFWDTETSGILISAGGTPKTTAEMMTKSTFTNTGWDFVVETINGPNDIWRMCLDGVQYPLLSWQFALKGDFTCPDGVDILDLTFLVDRWLAQCNETNNFCNCTDTNYDQQVDFRDFAILASHWLEGM